MCEIRLLEPSDIEVRAQQVTQKGTSLLLYKNARVDMAILDEKFGMFGWQREHLFKDGKNYCRVSIWDKENKQWVTKEDIGTESNTEREKGEASDAFKRACVNIGIGRELYTAPFIWVALDESEVSKSEKTGKWQINPRVNFEVKHIAYDSKRMISELEIVDQNGAVRYTFPRRRSQSAPAQEPFPETKIRKRFSARDFDDKTLYDHAGNPSDKGKTKAEMLLERSYKRYAEAGYPSEWDVIAYIRTSRDIDDETAARFASLFESYRQAMNNNR